MRKTEKVQPGIPDLEKENSDLNATLGGTYQLHRTQPKSLLPQMKCLESRNTQGKDSQGLKQSPSRSDSYPTPPLTSGLTLPSVPQTPARPTEAGSLIQTSSKSRAELLSRPQSSAITALALSTPIRYPVLDLSSQGLKDSDLEAVARLLEVYPYAQVLDLYGNELRFASVPRQDYSAHFSLRRLNISNNAGVEVGEGLSALLRRLPRLKSLEMERCGLNDADVIRLCLILEEMDRLIYLSLTGNPITNSVLPTLHSLLSALPELTLMLKETAVAGSHPFAYRLHTLPSQRCCVLS